VHLKTPQERRKITQTLATIKINNLQCGPAYTKPSSTPNPSSTNAILMMLKISLDLRDGVK
jgi:hypothetical protein